LGRQWKLTGCFKAVSHIFSDERFQSLPGPVVFVILDDETTMPEALAEGTKDVELASSLPPESIVGEGAGSVSVADC
jgi:hypothetical protein